MEPIPFFTEVCPLKVFSLHVFVNRGQGKKKITVGAKWRKYLKVKKRKKKKTVIEGDISETESTAGQNGS